VDVEADDAPCSTSSIGQHHHHHLSTERGASFNQLEWAHELSRPEAGCLLLAHPYMFRERQRYFYQAVILLLDHGPEGSYGIILNRPTQYKVRAGWRVCWGGLWGARCQQGRLWQQLLPPGRHQESLSTHA
jgi:hypothetical protein